MIFNTQRQGSKELVTILSASYTCFTCSTMSKGLSLLKNKQNEIALVICDLTHDLDKGQEFVNAIRNDLSLAPLPLLVVTTTQGNEYLEGIKLGANGFLVKPYDKQIISNIVKGAIEFGLHPQLAGSLQRDYLTGLLNRAGFFIEAKKLIDAQKPGYYVLSCFDIDSFKVINDQYGTSTGDAVLKELADKLQTYVTKVDGIACRYMADRFSMLYPAKEIDTRITKLYQKKVTQSLIIAHPVNIKIGHYFVQDKSIPVEIMCDRATLAEESIKGLYGVYLADYTDKMRDKLLQEQRVVNEMSIDLKRGEFTAWYQAQYDATTNTIVGAEALARWIKNGKVIPPIEFIPIFEKNGFIYELDKYIWEEVCKNIQKWTKQGLTPIPISVNVSRYDILQPDFKKVIHELLKKYEVPKSLFRLEVTESAFEDKERRVVHLVNDLIDEGFTIEIDDFGSGYSSLNVLKDVRASIVKLDMGFFEDTENTRRSGSIIESVIRMTHWLGMQVIAEGVDKQFQADYLLSVGCSIIQGYLYAKPIPMADFEKLIIGSKVAPKSLDFDKLDNFDSNAFWDAESQETLIFNSYVGGACIFEYHDNRTELLRYNRNYEAIFDYPFSFTFFNNESPEQFTSQASNKLYFETLNKAIESKKEETCELTLVKTVKNKKYYLYLELTIRLIAKSGDRYIFYCMMANKTKERLARKKEREANEKKLNMAKRLNSIVENIHGGVAAFEVMGKTLKYVFTNQHYFDILGVAKKDYLSKYKGVFTMVHPDDQPLLDAAYKQVIEGKNPHHLDFRVVRPSGEIRWLSCNVDNFVSDDDEKMVYIVFYNDITDITLSKQESMEMASRMEGIIQSVNGGLSAVAVNDEGKMNLLYANDQYYSTYGYTKEEYEESKVDLISLIMPDDVATVVSKGREVLLNGTPTSFEYRALKKDGSIINVKCSTSLSTMWGNNKRVLVSIVNDISQEKDTQEQLNVITNATNYIQNQPNFEKSIDYILYSMLDYFQCDRAFIVELDYSKQVFSCNYEVHKEGVNDDQEVIGTVRYTEVFDLLEMLSKDRFVIIPDVSKMTTNLELKELMLKQNVHSLVWGPIWREGKLIAFMGTNNPKPSLAKNVERMKVLGNSVSVLLTRRDFLQKIATDDASLKELDNLLRVVPSGLMKYSAENGNFAYINNNLVTSLGYTEAEFRLKFHNSFNEMVYSADRERVMRDIEAQEGQGSIGKFDFRIEGKDGH
ncbi:MAG: EAL domain-containing protein, partial [Bacilli bacterium]|nr:EAL domain-containing protein [Bacilli bacterium]